MKLPKRTPSKPREERQTLMSELASVKATLDQLRSEIQSFTSKPTQERPAVRETVDD